MQTQKISSGSYVVVQHALSGGTSGLFSGLTATVSFYAHQKAWMVTPAWDRSILIPALRKRDAVAAASTLIEAEATVRRHTAVERLKEIESQTTHANWAPALEGFED